MAKKKEENPMFTKKGVWAWVLCAPAALVAAAYFDSKKDVQKQEEKRRKKARAFFADWDEFDWWQDNQEL